MMKEIEVGTCDSCGFEHIPLKTYTRTGFKDAKDSKMCAVCAGSFIGNAHQYPLQYEDSALYKSLGYCTNLILQAIQKAKQ